MFPITKKSIFHLIETLKFLVSPEISWIEVQKNILEAILPVTMTIKWGPYGGKIKHLLHFIWYHLYHRLFKCQNGDFYWLKWPNLKVDFKPPISKHKNHRLYLGPYFVTHKNPSSGSGSSRNKPGPKVFDYRRPIWPQLQYPWSASWSEKIDLPYHTIESILFLFRSSHGNTKPVNFGNSYNTI